MVFMIFLWYVTYINFHCKSLEHLNRNYWAFSDSVFLNWFIAYWDLSYWHECKNLQNYIWHTKYHFQMHNFHETWRNWWKMDLNPKIYVIPMNKVQFIDIQLELCLLIECNFVELLSCSTASFTYLGETQFFIFLYFSSFNHEVPLWNWTFRIKIVNII